MAAPTTPEGIKALVAEARKVHKQHQDEKLALQNEQLALQAAWSNERAQLQQQLSLLQNALEQQSNQIQSSSSKGPLSQFVATNKNSPRKALSNLSTNIPSASGVPSSQKSPLKQSNTSSQRNTSDKAYKRLQKKYDALVKDSESKQATYDRAKTEWRKFKRAVTTVMNENQSFKTELRKALKAVTEAPALAEDGRDAMIPESTAGAALDSTGRNNREGTVQLSPRKTAQKGERSQHVSPEGPPQSRPSFLITRSSREAENDEEDTTALATPTKKSKKPLSSTSNPNAVSQQRTPEPSSQQHMKDFNENLASKQATKHSVTPRNPISPRTTTANHDKKDATVEEASSNEDVEMEEEDEVYPPFNSSQIGNFEENITLAERYASQDRRSQRRMKELEDERAAEEWEDIPDLLLLDDHEEEAFAAKDWQRHDNDGGVDNEEEGEDGDARTEVKLQSGLPNLYPLPEAEYYTPPPDQTIIEESLLPSFKKSKSRKRRSLSAKQLSHAFLDIDQQGTNIRLAKSSSKYDDKSEEEASKPSTTKILHTSPKSREKLRRVSGLAENVQAEESSFLSRAASKDFWNEQNKLPHDEVDRSFVPSASSPLRSVKGKQATSPSRADKQKARNAVLGLLQDSSTQRAKSILRAKELEKKRDEERERERSGSVEAPDGDKGEEAMMIERIKQGEPQREETAQEEWKGFSKRAQPLPQLSTQAFQAIQANASLEEDTDKMDIDDQKKKSNVPRKKKTRVDELAEEGTSSDEDDEATLKTAPGMTFPSVTQAPPVKGHAMPRGPASSATVTSSDPPAASQKRSSKPLFRPSSTSSPPPPWRAPEASNQPMSASLIVKDEAPSSPLIPQPPPSILKNRSNPSTQSSSPSQSQASQSQKKNVTFDAISPPRRSSDQKQEAVKEKANIYGKSKILEFAPRTKDEPSSTASKEKEPATASQIADRVEHDGRNKADNTPPVPEAAVPVTSATWLQGQSSSNSKDTKFDTPVDRISGISGSIQGTPSVVSRKNSALSKLLGPEQGGSAQPRRIAESAQPRRIAELKKAKAEITTPKVKEAESQNEATRSSVSDNVRSESGLKSEGKAGKKDWSSSRKPEPVSANKRSGAAANLSDHEESSRASSSAIKGSKKKRPRPSDLPDEVEADLSTVGMAIMKNLNTPSALSRRDRESTPLAESSSKSRNPRPLNLQKIIDKEQQNRLLKVKMENDRKAAIGRSASESSVTTGKKRSAEITGGESSSTKKRRVSKEIAESRESGPKKEEEEEDGEESSEEHPGERYLRDIHRKRREELRENPLKYKGNGAYQKQMPKSDEASESKQQVPYKEVVRDKNARKQMHGFDCDCCHGYYENATRHLPVEKRRAAAIELAKHNSRHRELLAPPTTPPGFWEFAFPESQEVERFNAEGKAMYEARQKQKHEAVDQCEGRHDYKPW